MRNNLGPSSFSPSKAILRSISHKDLHGVSSTPSQTILSTAL